MRTPHELGGGGREYDNTKGKKEHRIELVGIRTGDTIRRQRLCSLRREQTPAQETGARFETWSFFLM